MAQDIVQIFLNAPPVSRVLVVSMFVVSALVLSGVLDGGYIIFDGPSIFKFPLPELWRLCTCFLLTGGGFNFVLDLYFMWTYASGLEQSSPRFTQPGDFFIYLLFVTTVISTLAGFLLHTPILTSSLLLAFIHTFAQDNRGAKAHFVIVQIPVEFLPWAMLTLTLVLGGPPAALRQFTGVVAAHSYDFLTRLYPAFRGGKNYVQTPNVVKRLFGGEGKTTTTKTYGTAVRPGQAAPPQEPGRGWASGLSVGGGGAWGERGQGRRLGGS